MRMIARSRSWVGESKARVVVLGLLLAGWGIPLGGEKSVMAQEKATGRPTGPSLAEADAWAELVLSGVDREFPNKPGVVFASEAAVVRPRAMFPAFYGCFDWHSSVHGHWLLARLLRLYPGMPSAARVRQTLESHLSGENIAQEAAFFARDEHKSFERMYGWAWYLRLVIELSEWDHPDARRWRENLRPLETVLVGRIGAYLPLLEFPVRTGEHPDTGFALGQIIDYARLLENPELEALAVERAKKYYFRDRDYPIRYEPSGQDFFSSAWNEADLMRRVLPAGEFEAWLDRFLPALETQLRDGTIAPVTVSDPGDGKLVHLAGLNLHRSWCMQSVAGHLDGGHRLVPWIRESADLHLQAGLRYVNSGHYEGDHWLATFALYASTLPGSER